VYVDYKLKLKAYSVNIYIVKLLSKIIIKNYYQKLFIVIIFDNLFIYCYNF